MKKFHTCTQGLGFQAVAAVLNGLSQPDEWIRQEFVEKLGPRMSEPHVILATHSLGGRNWELKDGRDPASVEEKCFNGKFLLLFEEDVKMLRFTSATSGSEICCRRTRRGWTISLSVPFKDGIPYKGCYWLNYLDALYPERVEPINPNRW